MSPAVRHLTNSAQPDTVKAWDGPLRLFHWLLPLLVLSAWVSVEFSSEIGDRKMLWHRSNGLAILTLVFWRILWGLCGSSTARFSTFVRSPGVALSYAKGLATTGGARYLGHNPLGAYVVLALLATLFAQAALGLFAVDDNGLIGGPLHRLVSEDAAKWAAGRHAWAFQYILLPLVAVHIAVNVLYGTVRKERLIGAMLSGCKPRAAYADQPSLGEVAHPWRRALVCLVTAALLLFGAIFVVGGGIL